jgi:sugar O-acyltransferase (sialic acid O-acetyltransferase NeuD family)
MGGKSVIRSCSSNRAFSIVSNSKQPTKIIGCGAHGRVVADIARAVGEPISGFLDNDPGSAPANIQVEGPIEKAIPRYAATHRFVVAIGDAGARRACAEMVLAAGGELAILVHPSAVIAPDVKIGQGTVVMAGAIINPGTIIGRFAVINTGAIVDHDNIIEDNVQIAPGCSLAGKVICRRDCFVGTGATIIPHTVVGEGAYVAAGATVIRSVRAHTLVAGCPAREKKSL